MEQKQSPAEERLELYNPNYDTGTPLKSHNIKGLEVIVRSSGIFPNLYSSYLQIVNGQEPRSLNDQVYQMVLAQPRDGVYLKGVLDVFTAEEPAYANRLNDLDREKQLKADNNRAIYRAEDVPRLQAETPDNPSASSQEPYHDIVYSKALDKIGDLMVRYGLEPNLRPFCSLSSN